MDIILVSALISGIIYWVYKVNKERKTFFVDDNSFYQNGVQIDFLAATITISKYTYSVNQVSGIKINSRIEDKTSIIANNSSVEIEIDDFANPVHKIIFNGYSVEKDPKKFAQRLSIALRKAGSPNFI